MKERNRTVLARGGLVLALLVVGAGLVMQYGMDPLQVSETRRTTEGGKPIEIMSTTMAMTAVVPAGKLQSLDDVFAAAEAGARLVESRMNIYDETSELAQLNAAPAGMSVPLTPETLAVLRDSREMWQKTTGAFDVTASPLFAMWRDAARNGQMPSAEAIRQARQASHWNQLTLHDTGAIKSAETTRVDLGGIAKGAAIDRAVEAMIEQGCQSGIVDIGGDVRCFGTKPSGEPWQVGVADPFDSASGRMFCRLAVTDASVCTSGNYERFYLIGGEHFSHIVDPRPGADLGSPADLYPSVTVVAPRAWQADAWATALSVLGPEGFALLDEGVEAMVVIGTPENYRWEMTPGFSRLLVEPPQALPAEPAEAPPAVAVR